MSFWRVAGAVLLAAALAATMIGCGSGSSGASQSFGSISGMVTDNGVQLFTASGRAEDTATITVDGTNLSTEALPGERFVLRNVPPGLHTLVVRQLNQATAVVVGVDGGKETDIGDVVLRDAGSIAGTVTDADSHAFIDRAKVVVTERVLTDTADAMPHPVRVAVTNDDGFYALSGVPVGDYLMTIAKPGYAAVTLTLTVRVGATANGDTTLTKLPPAETGGMKGTVSLKMDDGSLRPLGGVLVRLAPQGFLEPERPAPEMAVDAAGNTVPLYPDKSRQPMPPYPREYYTFTAEDGSYALDGIPAGSYTAVAVRPGMEADKKPVAIVANSTLAMDFVLILRPPQAGVIEGIVTNTAAAGAVPQPITGAWVRAIVGPMPEPMPPVAQGMSRVEAAGGTAWGSQGVMIAPDEFVMHAQTDNTGHYKLLVPAVVTAIAIYAEGFVPQTVPVTVTPGASVMVDVALSPKPNVDVSLSGGVYTASVTAAGVVQREPVAGAMVYAQPANVDGGPVVMSDASAQLVYSAKTDDQGQYTLSLKPGVYMVYAENGDLRSERILCKVYENTTQNLVLRPQAVKPQPATAVK